MRSEGYKKRSACIFDPTSWQGSQTPQLHGFCSFCDRVVVRRYPDHFLAAPQAYGGPRRVKQPMARPGPQAGVAGAPPEPAQHIDALEAQLQELSTALSGRVVAAQAETLGAPSGSAAARCAMHCALHGAALRPI